ncbi:hypothetical protein FOMPIDRAFT_94825 [Fomitopsis schrenkii]|uniref:Uncharacterized protein n=1 Tax=Fomitopsis schrenkii TaxID=2126942 RepID=S8DUJ9_FOMSC|nr:hypothetical protein FOMPIDRAFT_94825 [Fomitopsis schrenkii]
MPPPSNVPSRILPPRVPSRAPFRAPSHHGSVGSTRSIAPTLPIPSTSSCSGPAFASSAPPARPSDSPSSTTASSLPHPVVASSVPTGSSSLPHPAPGPSTSSCPDYAAPGPSKPKRRGGYQPRKVSRAHDMAAGLTAFYGSPEQLLSRMDEFDKVWEPPN